VTTDVDRLPPTAYLVLEVLAARHRLGETIWPFPVSVGAALQRLDDAGLITRMHGNTPRTVRAQLTEAGKAAVLTDGYRSPNGGVEKPREALRLIAEYAEARADLVVGMQAIAETARRGLSGENDG
jgi:DNA-binding PadR family transcriptional regulator